MSAFPPEPGDPARKPVKGGDLTASPPDEMALMTRATDGDEAALSTLLERCSPQVRARIASKINPVWQASLDIDDVMQVTFLEAFLQIETFKPKGLGAFTAWLSQIAENNLRDAVRGLERAKRPNPRNQVRAGPADDSYVALVELLGMTNTTPSRQAAAGELRAILDQMLAELPEDYERVVRLMDLESRPASDAALELRRSSGAVHMLRARAHDRLKTLLGTPSKYLSGHS